MSATVLLRTVVSANLLRNVCKGRTTGFANFHAFPTLFSTMANKTAVCLLAEGAEEMEAIVTVDILRRAGVSKKFALNLFIAAGLFCTPLFVERNLRCFVDICCYRMVASCFCNQLLMYNVL